MPSFGTVPSPQGEIAFESALSDDRRALTLTRSGGTSAEVNSSTPPVVTKVFSVVLPVEADGEKAEIECILQGTVVLEEGTNASALLSTNGHTRVLDFTSRVDDSFTHTLPFSAYAPSECRVTVVLIVGQDSQNPETDAFVNFSTLDAEFLPRPA